MSIDDDDDDSEISSTNVESMKIGSADLALILNTDTSSMSIKLPEGGYFSGEQFLAMYYGLAKLKYYIILRATELGYVIEPAALILTDQDAAHEVHKIKKSKNRPDKQDSYIHSGSKKGIMH